MNAQTPPPPVQLMQLITARWLSKSVSVAADLGVADQLAAGPRSVQDLAAALGAHAPSLHRLLRALASVGVFEETLPGTFALSPAADFLRSDHPGSLRGMARFQGLPAHYRAWDELGHSVRTGECGFLRAHGQPFFPYQTAHPEEGAIFDQAMTSMSAIEVPAVLGAYDFAGLGTVVDVGGGHGALLQGVLDQQPAARGILFDLPPVVAGAPAHPRMAVEGGSFFDTAPAGGDAYLLKHILHDWSDAHCEAILGHIRKAMAPGAKVLVLEMLVPEGNAPDFAKLLDLEMLVMTEGGRERTAAEFGALFAKAGLRLSRVVPTQGPLAVVEAVAE